MPAYVLDPLERQSPERLEALAKYARDLAAWKREIRGRGDRGGSDNRSRPERGDRGTAGRPGESGEPRGSDVPGREDPGPDRAVDGTELEALEARGVSTDPSSYDDVPDDGAYVTVKEPKPGYRYYYWQWRDGDSWKNRYIGPVDGRD
nr:hypothetical protein [Halorubellus sp. JP-L1]